MREPSPSHLQDAEDLWRELQGMTSRRAIWTLALRLPERQQTPGIQYFQRAAQHRDHRSCCGVLRGTPHAHDCFNAGKTG